MYVQFIKFTLTVHIKPTHYDSLRAPLQDNNHGNKNNRKTSRKPTQEYPLPNPTPVGWHISDRIFCNRLNLFGNRNIYLPTSRHHVCLRSTCHALPQKIYGNDKVNSINRFNRRKIHSTYVRSELIGPT